MACAAGRNAYLTVNGERIDLTNWELDKDPTLADVTDSGSGHWEEDCYIRKSWTWAADLIWDSARIPEGLVLEVGKKAVIRLYVGEVAGVAALFYSGVTIITKNRAITDRRDAMKFRLEGKGQGRLSYPGQAAITALTPLSTTEN
jgi:hypothetical protein